MNRKILNLAIPNIISNLSIPLLSSVDTAVVGHLDKITYLGAIAIGTMLFNFIYWGFGFLRMGTTGLTAQAKGKQNEEENALLLGRSISVSLIIALGLIFLQDLISYSAFYLVNASPEVENLAQEYFNIRIYAAPATLALYAFHGWFLGNQNSKIPMFLSIIGNVLNIIFNLFFIYFLGMKSDGVALGTVVAQYISLIIAIIFLSKKYSFFFKYLDFKKILDSTSLKKFFNVNFDIFIRTMGLIFVFTYFTAVSAEFGEDILASNTILLQLWMILAYGIDGFAFAAESLVGKYFGAKDLVNLKKTIKLSFIWGLSLGVILALVYFIFGEIILSLYTNKQNIIDLSLQFFIWTIFAPIINSTCFIWDGIYIGATATKAMRNLMIFCTAIFFITFFLSKPYIGNHGLWLSMLLFMFLRGFTLTIFSKKYIIKPIQA